MNFSALRMSLRSLVVGIFFCVGLLSFAQDRPLDYDQVRSDDSVRDGAAAFHSGLYNKAILAFEKALQLKPESIMARRWLAEALYSSGLEEQALNEWKHVIQSGIRDEVLENWVEVLQARKSLDRETRKTDRYLPLYELSGRNQDKNGKPIFLRPTSVRPLPNGGYLVSAFGTEDVVEVSTNGNLTRRLISGVGGLRAPFDILPFRDRYYVSEFTADRIAILDQNGLKTKSFGETGRKDGQFLGPQFLATDGQALYVTDWGNARVSKFDLEGAFVLQFGGVTTGFAGLKGPTGIAASSDQIFVADKVQKAVYEFDTSGNWLATLGEGRLTAPEGLTRLTDGRLLVSDGAKVFFLDPANDSLVPFDPEWNQGLKVSDAVIDANQNLVMADFDDNKIRVLTEGHTIYSGLVVKPIRVNTRNYPQVSISFTVEDRWGRPVTGLDLSNFGLSESKTKIVSPAMEFQGFRSDESEVAVVVDRDPSMSRYDDDTKEAVGFLTQSWADQGGIWLYSAGNAPLPENQRLSGVGANQAAATDSKSLTRTGKFDLTVRLAASSMIPSLKRRTVVYLTAGTVPPNAFGRYNLNELTAFLKNNGVVFSVISLNDAPLAPELSYLMKETGGKAYSTKQDLRPFLDDIKKRPSGLYSLRYTTITPSEVSTRNIPVTVEVQHFKQSGRGELNYFAPK